MAPQHLIRNESAEVVYTNIKSLRDQSKFLDVSLVCEDGSRLPAHKIILAAHSDRFKRILGQMTSEFLTPVAHSIFLTGVNKEELSFILDFIYEGEVSVSQADLGRFLSVAEKLHINSLVNSDQSSYKMMPKIHSGVPSSDNSDQKSCETQKRKRREDITEEVYLASQNQTAEVEDVYESPHLEEETYETQPELDEEIFENQHLEDPTANSYKEESQFLGFDDVLNPKKTKIGGKENQMNKPMDNIDKNKVLIENLKVLGLSKLRKDILKNTQSRKFFKKIMSKPTMKLPCPVELMNSAQLIEWLTPEIRKDYIEQGLAPKVKVPWGDSEFHPKCWPDELWPWNLVSSPSARQKHSRPYNVSLVDTLKAAISKRLRDLNIDPDSYISEEYTEEEDVKKRRVRGLKVVNNRL